MAPKKKKSATKKSSAPAKSAHGAGKSNTDAAVSSATRLPLTIADEEVSVAGVAASSTATTPRTKEAALLFWVNSALRRFAPRPAASTAAPTTATTTTVQDNQDARASPEQRRLEEPPEAVAAQPTTTSTEQQQQQQQQQQQEPPVTSHAEQGSAAVPDPHMRDVLPVFDALVEGQLGDVALDVWLLGQVSLTHHPEAFARVLEDHEQAASGPLHALLSSVTPYFLVRGASFYTLDATTYPALPLIVLLLQSSKVRKVILHPLLLYKLLFMFLGTDKVEIANVVDLGVWLATERQGSPVLASMVGLDTVGYDVSSGTLSVAALKTALPAEAQQMLDVASTDVERSLLDRADGVSREDAGTGEDTVAGADVPRASSSGQDSGDHSEAEEEEGGEDKDDDASDTTHDDDDNDDDDALSDDALDMLQQLEPCVPGDGDVVRRRRRPRRRSRETSPRGSTAETAAADATRALHAFNGMASVHRFYTMILESEAQTTSTAEATHSSREVMTTPLAALCQRRTYAVFLCALMTYHGFFISRDRFEAMMSDLDEQLDALAQCATVLLDPKPSSSSSSASSPSNDKVPVHPPSTSTPVAASAQPTNLLLALSAQEVVEYVLTQLVDDTQKRAVEAIVREARGQTSAAAVAAGEVVRFAQHHVESCFEALNTCADTHGPQESAPVIADENSSSHAETGGEASAMATVQAEAAQDALTRCREFLRLWLAVQERRAFKKLLATQWSVNNAKLQVRVLPTTASTTTATASTSDAEASSSSSQPPCDAAVAVGEAIPVSNLSYSVHPQWELHLGTTGRIFASRPNIQTVAKQSPAAAYAVTSSHNNKSSPDPVTAHPMLRQHPLWTLRHLYIAPPGCTLVSLDFNQVELRVLAHLSRDPTLTAQLTSGADVLLQMAQTVLRVPRSEDVQPWQRQAIKVIVYGLLYGMGTELMTARLAQLTRPSLSSSAPPSSPPVSSSANEEQGPHDAAGVVVAPLQAKDLVDDFYASYPFVRQYLQQVRNTAVHQSTVLTLGGVKHLVGPAHQDANRRRQAAVAWAIQGGAADLLHEAMHLVHSQRHALIPFLPATPVALVAAAHDELVYAVPTAAVSMVLPRLRVIMEDEVAAQVHLRVPLRVTARVGPSLGELEKVTTQ